MNTQLPPQRRPAAAFRPRIVALGSINMDLVAVASALPKPGETVMGDGFATLPGGKGANQAVAAARLGADVRMVGRVGDDVFGPMLIAGLEANGVDVSDVMTTPGSSSGIAVILLDGERQNSIVGIYGANMACDAVQVEAASRALDGADALLLQMEIPSGVSLAAAQIARRMGVRVIFDPAPASAIPLSSYEFFDIVAPNQSEAEVLTGVLVDGIDSAYEAARILRSQGARTAIIKLGEQGVVYASEEGSGHVAAFQVEAIDTVAAGDGFAGALAVALAEGQPVERALRFASGAGALVVTKRGAQDAMPDRAEVERLLHSQQPYP
ncbi:MAG: ribokinase [Chloroflexota bacterium]|nr:ribokinase [Chloroflexota bacterium]